VAELLDPGDPIWDDHRGPSERWRDEWAARARLHPDAARHGFVLTRGQCELSEAEIRSRLRRRIWWSPRYGVLSPVYLRDDSRVAAGLSATAAAWVRPGSVISHEIAAILHGLPVLEHPRTAILSVEAGTSGGRAHLAVHLAALPIEDVSTWYGVAVTSVARTVVDIARRGRIAGLITADAALHERMLSSAELQAAVAAAVGWPGIRAARWVADHADGRSESPLESLTRARLIEVGFPAPELQVELPGTGARVDMYYRAHRLVIEADGLAKYTKASDLRAEKRREMRIVSAGDRVLRVLWEQVIGDASAFIACVRRAS
jgi:very-short-patch-repair endonuclease